MICGSFTGTTGATVVVVGVVVIVEVVAVIEVVVELEVDEVDVVGWVVEVVEVVVVVEVEVVEVVVGPYGGPEQTGATGKFWLEKTFGVEPQYMTDVNWLSLNASLPTVVNDDGNTTDVN